MKEVSQMSKVQKFEDLIAWQKAKVLATSIYRLSQRRPFSRDFGFKDQIQRAAISIMSNIAEGFERGRAADYCNFLRYAKASCAELRSQLYVAVEIGHISKEDYPEVSTLAQEVARLLNGLLQSIKRHKEEAS
jgi:four helix bundle protein